MTSEALLLVGRDRGDARDVIETHASRLERRGVVDGVHTATFAHEPVRELRRRVKTIDADQVYAIPTCVAHTGDTIRDIPAALSSVPGDVRCCEPLGGSPAITDALIDRASAAVAAGEDVSLVLVGFGSGSTPYQRQVAEYHAARIEDRSVYGEVHTCYLHQNPAVECARYAASNDRVVAIPLFLARSEVTRERIPAKLDLDRGGLAYGEPLGDHPRVTDAIHAELERARVLASKGSSSPLDARLTGHAHPVATDGEGPISASPPTSPAPEADRER